MRARVLLLLTACSPQSDEGPAPVTDPPPSAVIGSAGGSVALAGANVVVPPGALAADTTISVTLAQSGFPALPDGWTAEVFALEPHGQSFAADVLVTLPYSGDDPDPVIAAAALEATEWSLLDSTRDGDSVRAAVRHFSHFTRVAGPPKCGAVACAQPFNRCGSGCCVDGRCQPPGCACGVHGGTCRGGSCVGTVNWCGAATCPPCGARGQPCCGFICTTAATICCEDGDDTCLNSVVGEQPDHCRACGAPGANCCDGSQPCDDENRTCCLNPAGCAVPGTCPSGG